MEFLDTRARAFRYAFAGWWYVLRTQRNAWIHALASIIVILLGLWLQLSLWDWALLVIAIAMVWLAEFFNTALEITLDLVSPERNELARAGKDVGAAAVLIAAISAFVIGLLILGPPLWERIGVFW